MLDQRAGDDADEPIYFTTALASSTRQKLAVWSELKQCSLATFAGLLIAAFLDRHERDPRDLAMIHYLTERLDSAGAISEDELREAIARCEKNASVRLPPGYWPKWLRGRLLPVIKWVDAAGTRVALTDELLERLLRALEH